MNILLTGATGNVGKAVCERAQWHCENIDYFTKVTKVARHSNDTDVLGHDISYFNIADWLVRKHCPEPFDLVVLAHGTQEPNPIAEHSQSYWDDILRNNLTATAAILTALVGYDKLAEGSLIVGMSSIQAFTPRAGRSAYAAAKAGLEGYLRAAAAELAPKTRVIGLRLGQLTETMHGVTFSEEQVSKLKERSLLSDWVAPSDVARLCFDLYEQKSMTGCILDVDSGHGRNVW